MNRTVQPNDGDRHTGQRTSFSTGLSCVGVMATGQAVGEQIVCNEDLQISHGFDPDWIFQRTGIRQRRLAADGVTTGDLAYQAARDCLQRSDVDDDEVDLLLVATLSPDQLVPSVASCVQDRLGLSAGAMDIHASCAGFVYALVTASQFIATGTCRTVLVVGADTSSRFADPADRTLYPLFGDGAGALLLGTGQLDQGILAFDLGSDGSGRDLLQVPRASRPRLEMNGPRVFKWAVSKLCQSIDNVARRAGMRVDDIDCFIFHQANVRILHAVAKAMNIDLSKIVTNMEYLGNTATASIPLALDQALTDKQIRPGDHVLVAGFGGGLCWGSCLIHW